MFTLKENIFFQHEGPRMVLNKLRYLLQYCLIFELLVKWVLGNQIKGYGINFVTNHKVNDGVKTSVCVREWVCVSEWVWVGGCLWVRGQERKIKRKGTRTSSKLTYRELL